MENKYNRIKIDHLTLRLRKIAGTDELAHGTITADESKNTYYY